MKILIPLLVLFSLGCTSTSSFKIKSNNSEKNIWEGYKIPEEIQVRLYAEDGPGVAIYGMKVLKDGSEKVYWRYKIDDFTDLSSYHPYIEGKVFYIENLVYVYYQNNKRRNMYKLDRQSGKIIEKFKCKEKPEDYLRKKHLPPFDTTAENIDFYTCSVFPISNIIYRPSRKSIHYQIVLRETITREDKD